MNENLALLLAVLYLIYRFKTYKKTNKIIEDRIENIHKPYFKRVRDVLECSEEEAEKVGLALDKYFVPLESKFYKIDDSTYSFVDAGGLKGTFSIDQNYNLLTCKIRLLLTVANYIYHNECIPLINKGCIFYVNN